MAQQQYGSVMLGELCERGFDVVLAADRSLNRFAGRMVLASEEGDPANNFLAAQVRNRGVGGDPVEPGLEREVFARAGQRPVGLDEGILRQVLGQSAIADHPVKIVQNRSVI